MPTILIVDDSPKIRRLLEVFLKMEGFDILLAEDGAQVISILENHVVDLILADIMMPNMDGFQLVKTLRENHNDVPVLMITAKNTFADKKLGFDLGADDYMTKPIDIEEMLLRIKALLRRSKIYTENQIVLGNLVIDQKKLEVRMPGSTLVLPQKEFNLLYKLLSYPEKIFTRQELMDEIWGMDSESTPRTVDVHIKRLRERFENVKEFEIVTVRGVGYKSITHAEESK